MRMVRNLLALLAVAWSVVPAAAQTPPRLIEWQLKNPFRYFEHAADTRRHADVLATLTPEQRKTPILSSEQRLAAAEKGLGWARHVFRNVKDEPCLYSSRSECSDYLIPKSHTVLLSAPRVSGPCQWRIGDFLKDQADCRTPLETEIPYPDGIAIALLVNGAPVDSVPGVLKVEDLLIVALGDSFASGEGNPDEPVAFEPVRTLDYDSVFSGYPRRKGFKVGERIRSQSFSDLAAGWTHRSCHRSLYSHQLRAALHLAVTDPSPRRAVTFLSLACTGAEIVDGLFEPFQGREREPLSKRDPQHARHEIALSQLSGIAHALCKRGTLKLDRETDFNTDGDLQAEGPVNLFRCEPHERRRKIDLLLLSIGGNDVGFSGLVANSALRDDYLGVARMFNRDPTIRPQQAARYLKQLPGRYRALAKAIKHVLGVDTSARVLITTYPQVAYQFPNQICRSGRLGMDVSPAWDLRSSVATATERFVEQQLYPTQKTSAAEHGWTFIDAFRRDRRFLSHGVCSFSTADRGDPSIGSLQFPRKRYPRSQQEVPKWVPFQPAAFKPYAARQRWFRTPNDAFLTVNFHSEAATVSEGGRDLQITAWSAYSGAFHPTAEGHAAMAEAVYDAMVKLLK